MMEQKEEQLYRVDADLFLRLYPGHYIDEEDDTWDILGARCVNTDNFLFIDETLQQTTYWQYPQPLSSIRAHHEVE